MHHICWYSFQVSWSISSALLERTLERQSQRAPFSVSLHLFPDAKMICSPLLLFCLSSGKLNKEHFWITFPWAYVLSRLWPLDFYRRKANGECVQVKGQKWISALPPPPPPAQSTQIKRTFFTFPDPRNKFLKWVGPWREWWFNMAFDFVVSREVDPEHREFPQVPLGGESLTMWVAGRLPHASGL